MTRSLALAIVWCWPVHFAAAGIIEKVVLFPTADSVRVQAVLKGPDPLSGISLTGRITPADAGAVLWEGSLGSAGKSARVEQTVKGLTPKLWSPGSPFLYTFALTAMREGRLLDTHTARFGFRSVESRNGQILLNGKPIFLRGLAINPPGRSIPDSAGLSREFAYDYVRFMRSRNFNCIRMNFDFKIDPRQQFWFDACDEMGMLVYQGCYGSPPTGSDDDRRDKEQPPEDVDASVAAYQEVFETFARHPSVIVYILSNELPYQGQRGEAWHRFLTTAYERLKSWDSTRLYIGNAGYGEGKEGDINDVHRYWGWYYNSFLTYYNLRKAHEIYGRPGAVQPFTFSECVGSFTSSLGEFNMIFRKQIGAQLHWTGHSPDQKEAALAYQAFMAKHACESFRTLRESNPRLAGLMPFTILFYNWNGLSRFEQMKPKPVADAMAVAYQPVLLSWEMWTPQVYAGSTITAFAHVVNDAEDFSDFLDAKLVYRVENASGKTVLKGELEIPPVPYFGHHKTRLSIALPAETATADYLLKGTLLKDGKPVARNDTPLFIAGKDWRRGSPRPAGNATILLHDPSGRTRKALTSLGIATAPYSPQAALKARFVIMGENSLEESAHREFLTEFVRNDGRVLILAQDFRHFPTWLPAGMEPLAGTANDPEYHRRKRPTPDQMNINLERPDHPVFADLTRSRFHLWSDYTGWDQSKPGFPAVYPVTRGFKLRNVDALGITAVLANYDRGLEGVALCEVFDGGIYLVTGLDLVRRIGLDPVADQVLANLVAYLCSEDHQLHPLVTEPVRWGRYATEKGLITGPLNGLVVNCRWVQPPTDSSAKPPPDNEGAWNVLPGDQYVPFGRRPFGPYGYSAGTSTVELDKNAKAGFGVWHARLPAGRKAMITAVENPTSRPGRIEIDGNGSKQVAAVAPGQTLRIRNELPPHSTAIMVRYTGDKHLVLLETTFE